MAKGTESSRESYHFVPPSILCCGVFLVGQTILSAQSIEGSWTTTALSNSCDVEHKGLVGGVTTMTIVRTEPNTFSFVDANAAALDPAHAAASAASVIVGAGPGKYTYKYHLAETRTTTETVMDWTLTLVNSETLQIDGWAQEYVAGKARDAAGVIPLCILHSTLRRGPGSSGFSVGGAATDSAACSSPKDCMETSGYDTTLALAAGLMGLLSAWGASQMASLAGVVGKTLDAVNTAAAIKGTKDQFDSHFLSDPNTVSEFGAVGAIADLGKQMIDLFEEGNLTTKAILLVTANTDAKIAIDALIPPVGLYDTLAGATNLVSGTLGGRPILPTVDPLTALKDIETAILPSDAIPQPPPMEPVFLPPDMNWAQDFVDQTSKAPDISSMVPPPGGIDAPTDDGGGLEGGDDS
jgi:hypothetical protein